MSDEDLKNSLLTEKFVVMTEKMDGSNACLTRDTVYARSHGHEATGKQWDLLKKVHSDIQHLIPPRLAVYGEWLYAKHSVKYYELPSPFLVFAALDMETDTWLSWSDVYRVAEALGLNLVPEIKTSPLPHIEDTGKGYDSWPDAEGIGNYGPKREGYVIRVRDSFPSNEFQRAVGKVVRNNHVQTEDHHWKTGDIETNDFRRNRQPPEANSEAEVEEILG